MGNAYAHSTLRYAQTGQVVEWYPSDSVSVLEGAPSSAATYSCQRGDTDDDATAEFSGTSTIDATSTTVDAASGYSQTNRRRLYVAATTSITVGRRYVVTNAYGQREVVVVAAIASADYVDLEDDLAYDYASADAVKGLRCVFTIDATWIADEDNILAPGEPPYRLTWTYATATATRKALTTFTVARRASEHGVSIADLKPLFPDVVWVEWTTQRGRDFAPQIDAAYQAVCWDLRMAGYSREQVADPLVIDRLTTQRAVALIAEALAASGSGQLSQWATLQAERYKTMFQAAIGTGLRTWLDAGTDGAITSNPARQLWLRGR